MESVGRAWRRQLRRELTGLIALKIAALALLWWLFFAPAPHAGAADEASRRFGLAAAGSAPRQPAVPAAPSAPQPP
jgi:hypothetical protein